MMKRKIFIFFLSLTILFFLTHLGGCTVVNRLKQPEGISNLDLSPDGEVMLFSYYNNGFKKKWRTRTIGFYDFKKNEFSRFVLPPNQVWESPSYSWDGKKIVFSISPVIDGAIYYDKNKFAIMDLEDFSYRIITQDWALRFLPKFSPDGTQLLYSKPESIRVRGKTRYKRWDIWGMDIWGKERTQYTHYKYYKLYAVRYLHDRNSVIFSAKSSRTMSIKEDANFIKKYGTNSIFIIDLHHPPAAKDLKPVIQIKSDNPLYRFSSLADVTRDGNILFRARTDRIDRINGIDPGKGFSYDLFIRDENGNNRLTMAKSLIVGATISSNSPRVAFISMNKNDHLYNYYYLNGDGTGLTELKLPEKQEEWLFIQPKETISND